MKKTLRLKQESMLIFLVNEYRDFEFSKDKDSILSNRGVNFCRDILNKKYYDQRDRGELNHLLDLFKEKYSDVNL